MNTTLGDIIKAQPAVARLMQQPLRARTAFSLCKLVKEVQNALEHYEKTRIDLAQRLGTLSADKSRYDFEGTRGEEFAREMSDLLVTPIELQGERLQCEQLGDAAVSPADLLALSWLIVE